MEVFFCDRCSSRITEGDLAADKATSFGTLTFCEACWSSPEVKKMVKRSTGIMAAVQEGGAGATSHETRGQKRTPVGRKTPAGKRRGAKADRRRHRRHPSPGHLRTIDGEHASTGHHLHVRHRPAGLSTKSLMVFFGAAALVAFIVVGAVLLLASRRRVSYSRLGGRAVAAHTLSEAPTE